MYSGVPSTIAWSFHLRKSGVMAGPYNYNRIVYSSASRFLFMTI
jgi:hypothetical protein